jgi:hypothetical protein
VVELKFIGRDNSVREFASFHASKNAGGIQAWMHLPEDIRGFACKSLQLILMIAVRHQMQGLADEVRK